MTTVAKLVHAFETGEIGSDEFPHERHVRVAWGLAQRYGHAEGLERLRAGIGGIAARAGRPEAYHETITRAWFELIAGADALEHHPELFDKTLLGRYYSPARLAAGRAMWVEPDLHPLRLPPPAVAQPALPAVLRRIPAPVAVLATRANRTVHATTVSSITSVSQDPALVSVCLANHSRALELVRDAPGFTLSILAADQERLALHFADDRRPEGTAQFADVPHRGSPFGPVLADVAASIGCRVHGIHGCGDHHIVVGHVEAADSSERAPLVRHDGRFH
jgi:flavin reductase (DIM6/NTAB) family NADH-FMN oxidoreductase RutF